MIELEGAILCPEPDPRVITVKYAPKGDRKLARCTTWAYAVDILGPLSWWDESIESSSETVSPSALPLLAARTAPTVPTS